jgi:hypothetical protein
MDPKVPPPLPLPLIVGLLDLSRRPIRSVPPSVRRPDLPEQLLAVTEPLEVLLDPVFDHIGLVPDLA